MFVDPLNPRAESAENTRLRILAGGQLLLAREGRETAVSVHRCFPWSKPLNWLSLRNEEGQELELLENPETDLDEASKKALFSALQEAAFVFRIEEILEVREEFELRVWRVRLKEGERVFQTKLNAWPRELGSGSLLIQDVGNDLYFVPDLEKLDSGSQKKLWAFMDDD